MVISLFTGFGLLLLYKAYKGKDDGDDERAEIEEELKNMRKLSTASESLLDQEKGKDLYINILGHTKKKSEGQKWYQRSVFTFILFSLMC